MKTLLGIIALLVATNCTAGIEVTVYMHDDNYTIPETSHTVDDLWVFPAIVNTYSAILNIECTVQRGKHTLPGSDEIYSHGVRMTMEVGDFFVNIPLDGGYYNLQIPLTNSTDYSIFDNGNPFDVQFDFYVDDSDPEWNTQGDAIIWGLQSSITVRGSLYVGNDQYTFGQLKTIFNGNQ